MTKAELIEEVSRVVEMTRKDSEVIVEAIFDSIVKSLRSGDKIEIRGFGSFRTASGSRAWAAIRKPALAWKCPPSASPTSSPARN
jgi:nucleoid DNA-binding protein